MKFDTGCSTAFPHAAKVNLFAVAVVVAVAAFTLLLIILGSELTGWRSKRK